MSVRVSISDGDTVDAIQRALGEVPKKAAGKIRVVVRSTAFRVESRAKERIQKPPKTGRVYQRGKIRHQASAPGESPATDTGVLASRVFHSVEQGGMEASVWSDVNYSGYLERGTTRMAPRPYLAPALRENEAQFVRDIDRALVEALEP